MFSQARAAVSTPGCCAIHPSQGDTEFFAMYCDDSILRSLRTKRRCVSAWEFGAELRQLWEQTLAPQERIHEPVVEHCGFSLCLRSASFNESPSKFSSSLRRVSWNTCWTRSLPTSASRSETSAHREAGGRRSRAPSVPRADRASCQDDPTRKQF